MVSTGGSNPLSLRSSRSGATNKYSMRDLVKINYDKNNPKAVVWIAKEEYDKQKKWNENSSENTGLDQKKKYVKIISKNVLI